MRSQHNGMDWNDQAVSTLRALWSDGHSTAEIGRRMGVTKNAIVGKVHRLNLSGRPSPIRRSPGPKASRQKRVAPPVDTGRRATPAVTPLARHHTAALPVSACVRTPPVSPPVSPLALPLRGCCQWPVGEPRSPAFRLCEAPAIAGRPYCEAHCRAAYARPARVLALASA